jgi:hypothetical protein
MSQKPPIGRAVALAALFVGLAGAAQAQSFVGPLCQGYVSPQELHYDTPEHARWYKRFWTGECDHLLACLPGSPNWNDIATKLVAKGGPAERAVLQPQVCRLGQRLGLEWSRERNVRRISTSDLRRYNAMLQAAGDPLRGVETVDAAVEAQLKAKP